MHTTVEQDPYRTEKLTRKRNESVLHSNGCSFGVVISAQGHSKNIFVKTIGDFS
jgi:hypothetical protein